MRTRNQSARVHAGHGTGDHAGLFSESQVGSGSSFSSGAALLGEPIDLGSTTSSSSSRLGGTTTVTRRRPSKEDQEGEEDERVDPLAASPAPASPSTSFRRTHHSTIASPSTPPSRASRPDLSRATFSFHQTPEAQLSSANGKITFHDAFTPSSSTPAAASPSSPTRPPPGRQQQQHRRRRSSTAPTTPAAALNKATASATPPQSPLASLLTNLLNLASPSTGRRYSDQELKAIHRAHRRRQSSIIKRPASPSRTYKVAQGVLGQRMTTFLLGNDEVPGLLGLVGGPAGTRKHSTSGAAGREEERKKKMRGPRLASRVLRLKARLGKNVVLVLQAIVLLAVVWVLFTKPYLRDASGVATTSTPTATRARSWMTNASRKVSRAEAGAASAAQPTGLRIRSPSAGGSGSKSKSFKKTKKKTSPPITFRDPAIYAGLPEHALTMQPHPEENGLLKVNMSLPAEAHPIYQLIRENREKWHDKVSRQSRTLLDAVNEYKRRNRGLAPPVGFDKWWRFVVEHNVSLPDEYDQINRDLLLFRGLAPADLRARVERMASAPDTFTLIVRNKAIRLRSTYQESNIGGADDRVDGQVQLLTEFGLQKWLPDFQATYSVHDTATGLIDYHHRSDLINAYEEGEWYSPDGEIDTSVRGWENACMPSSRIRTDPRSFNRFRPATGHRGERTFIADHAATFDLCQHPEISTLHGVTSGKRQNMDPELKPMFCLSKTTVNTDILGIPVEQWQNDLPVVPWHERTKEALLWRGSNTGAWHAADTTWRLSHRTRLVEQCSADALGDVDLLPAPKANLPGRTLEDALLSTSRHWLNAKYLDVAFTGQPIQCNEADGTCDELREGYEFREDFISHQDALQYKYVLDVDGNAWSARARRLFAGGHLVFKSTIMPEFWTDRIQPWVHYVPIQVDYSDLHDALLFFRTDKYGEDGLAQQIAEEGRRWADTHWQRVDMAAYVARLYLEWARLLSPNRASADFVYHPDMELPYGQAFTDVQE